MEVAFAQDKPRSLAKDLGVDVLAVMGAGVSVAPFISLIDMVRVPTSSPPPSSSG